MDKVVVFVNDAVHAEVALGPLAGGEQRHWILVACPPALTRHIGRWVSTAARQQWRDRWAAELFAKVEPVLKSNSGSRVETMVARRPLVELATRIDQRLGGVKVFDARRPRLSQPAEPLSADAPDRGIGRWAGPVAVTTGLGAMLALAD